MPLLHNIPIPDQDGTISIHDDRIVAFRALNHIVWICLAKRSDGDRLPDPVRFFPAVVDIGYTHNLGLSHEHLTNWMKLDLADFLPMGKVNARNADGSRAEVEARDANLWLRSNIPHAQPLFVELDRGFTYYGTGRPPDPPTVSGWWRRFLSPKKKAKGGPPGPPLPLLGARTLQTAGLQLFSDYRNMRFSIYESTDPLFFGQYLVQRRLASQEQIDNALGEQRVRFDGQAPFPEPWALFQFLRMRCDPRDAGRHFAEVAADHQLLPKENLGALLARTAHEGNRIGEILVRHGVISRELLEIHLEKYHRVYRAP